MPGDVEYLIDLPEREFEGVRRLFRLPLIAARFFEALGLPIAASWFATEVPFKCLATDSQGDVDILGGHLAAEGARLAGTRGGAASALVMNYLVAIEVKCAYLDAEDARIKSAKDSTRKRVHTQLQLRKLLDLGFDRVVLLDIIATPPSAGGDGQAWIRAAGVAEYALDLMRPVLEERSGNLPVGHWVWPIGAVVGGDESMRGAGAPIELRRAEINPRPDGLLEVRGQVNRGLMNHLDKGRLSPGPPFLWQT